MMQGMNQVQAAWLRAVEEKTERKINVESQEDIRVLARMNVHTYSPETLVFDDDE